MEFVQYLTQQFYLYKGWPIEPQPILLFFLNLESPWLKVALGGMAILGAPVMEETLFRGILYPYFKGRLGFGHATWLTSALFAASHLHGPSFPVLFVLGMAFTLVYEWTGNLASSIAFHSFFNALSLGFLLLKQSFL